MGQFNQVSLASGETGGSSFHNSQAIGILNQHNYPALPDSKNELQKPYGVPSTLEDKAIVPREKLLKKLTRQLNDKSNQAKSKKMLAYMSGFGSGSSIHCLK